MAMTGPDNLAVFERIVTSTSRPGTRQSNLSKVTERFQIRRETAKRAPLAKRPSVKLIG